MKAFNIQTKLFSCLKTYDKKTFMSDLMAGIIVGIVALPLAIAFGIASGVTPEKGIITAIVAGLVISLFGGSKVQIGGPTGAFIIIIYGIIQKYGFEGLTIATLMAGLFLVLFGLLRLGTIIKYIPYPIVVGFTSGIAVTIFTTQIKDLFGLQLASVPSDFIEKWVVYIQNLTTEVPDSMELSQYDLPEHRENWKVWSEGVSDEKLVPGGVSLTSDESRTVSEVMTEIKTYMSELALKIICGEASLEDWDAAVANLDGMGIQKAIDAEQAALDRFNAR